MIQNATVATIGTFDGVHTGHLEIIRRIIDDAAQSGRDSLILTFFPHPRMVIGSDEIKLLNTLDERISLLADAGLDHLIVHPFDQAFSSLEAEDFVAEVLSKKLRAEKIIVGHDHRFGRNRSAGFEDLVLLGKKYGFEVEQIEAEKIDTIAVSSTRIREALLVGDMPLANKYLGYEYPLGGTVTTGRQLGRTLGFPTANLSIAESYKLIPAHGVYLVRSEIRGRKVFGVMNIGNRPTVSGEGVSIEAHFLDFDAELYGEFIVVRLLRKLRDEQKFGSLEDLKTQISKDIRQARKLISAQ